MQTKTFQDYIAGIKRRKGMMLIILFILVSISAGLAFGLPSIYKSTASILIEQQEIPQDLVRTTVTSFADQRIQVISQRVMTRNNLLQTIKKYNLYIEDQENTPTEELIKNMKDNIELDIISADVVDPRFGRPTQATIAFTLSFSNESPALAQKVANELATLYLKENIKSRTQTATETSSFLKEETTKLNRHINELEEKLANFKENHSGSLPDLVQLNFNLLDRTDREISSVNADIRALQERSIYLDSELTLLASNNQLYAENGDRLLGPKDRLKVLETQLVSLKATYQKNHPSLIRLQREIDALRSETNFEKGPAIIAEKLTVLQNKRSELLSKYSRSHPSLLRIDTEVELLKSLYSSLEESNADRLMSNAEDNPAYTQLSAQLEATRSELSALEDRKKELYDRRDLYELRINETPQVERGFRKLTRDYDNAWMKYKELKAKQMEAELAEVLEAERKGERFTLIEPPQLPEAPEKPNRVVILLLGIAIAIGGSLASTAFLESIDTKIYGRKGVITVLDETPLAVIPYIDNPVDQRMFFLKIGTVTLVLTLLVAGILALIQFFVIPLDVAWFVAMRKMGISY